MIARILITWMFWSLVASSSFSVEIPKNGKLSYSGNSWVCSEGFEKYRDECLAVKIPKNGKLSYSGNSWVCSEGYKKRQDKCFVMTPAEIAQEKQREKEFLAQRSGTSRAIGDRSYTITGTFDGCSYGKYYELTNGMYLRCDEYNYFYEYRPKVFAKGSKVYKIGSQKVKGTIVEGRTITTQIDGEWEGCNWDTHRLTNGMYLSCNTYFYEYGYHPTVKILIISGVVQSVSINDSVKDGVTVTVP